MRQSAGDFEVEEELGYAPGGDGEHDYLWLEKQHANTPWVAHKLARHAGIRDSDVGFAGMKDRRAVTRQWFSVRRPSSAGTDWAALDVAGVRILDIARHNRKLRRGALRANRFRIALRGIEAPQAEIDARLKRIKSMGVPNYFGEQRFGRGGANLDMARALFAGRRLRRNQRSIALSAARSFLFNHILEQRVLGGSWDRLLEGECACLDGSASFFVVEQLDDDIRRRCAAMDIHPGGALWGGGESPCHGEVVEFEQSVVAAFAEFRAGLESQMQQSRRALRLAVRDLEWRFDGETLWLLFRLGRGGYATAVLRELAILHAGL